MEDTERAVRTWMASGREQDIDTTVSGIASGETSLLNVVKALGEYLTSEEDELRRKGVEFLSAVLAKSPPDKLNRNSVRVLVKFYISKLDDTETIVPALKGLVTLAPLPAFVSGDTIEVFQALCAHVKMKALVQAVRYNVFSIIDAMVARHREALKNLGSEFLTGYIYLADGEKDPRNLMIAFAIGRVIGVEFDISQHIEDFFNILFCYFPISFRPPPDDPYGITADDLRERLRLCLNSTPAFGPMAIPLFIEKLNAGSPVTKRDTLKTLSVCMPVYGSAVMRAHSKKLWSSLRMEIFQPTDKLTEEEALKTMQDLVKTIHSQDNDNTMEQDVEGFAKDLCEECLKILKEPEKSQAIPATKVFGALLSTTTLVSRYALDQIIPHLLKLFADPDEIANRASTLAHLASIVETTRDLTDKDKPEQPIIFSSKDQVLGIFTTALKTRSTALPALNGLRGLVDTKDLLTDEELGFVVHSINEVIQDDEDDEISDSALDLLAVLAVKSPIHLSEQTFPYLFSSLPDVAPTREADQDRQRCWMVLAALRRLSTPPALFETLVIRLLTKIDLVMHTASTEDEPSAAYIHALLHTISSVLAKKVAASDTDVPKYIEKLVPKLYEIFILSHSAGFALANVPRLVDVTSDIIALVIETISQSKQEGFYANLFPAFLDGDISAIISGKKPDPPFRFSPFKVDAANSEKATIPLFAAALIPLRKETQLPLEDLSDFVLSLVKWGVYSAETSSQRSATQHMVASIINRRPDDLAVFFDALSSEFWPGMIQATSAQSDSIRQHAIHVWKWVSKALLVHNHPSGASFAQKLFEVFNDESTEVAWAAARAAGEIGGSDTILIKRHHAIIRPLYAQKYCNLLLPRLVEGAQNSGDERLQNTSLVGLASLIKAVPRAVYENQIPALMPLLIRGLEVPDADVRANVIETLHASASAKEKDNDNDTGRNVFAEHTSTLVSAMIKNSDFKKMHSVRVRLAALRFLGLIPFVVRYDIIHPHRNSVLRDLANVLDDPKKAVRMEAVETRSRWFTSSGLS